MNKLSKTTLYCFIDGRSGFIENWRLVEKSTGKVITFCGETTDKKELLDFFRREYDRVIELGVRTGVFDRFNYECVLVDCSIIDESETELMVLCRDYRVGLWNEWKRRDRNEG